MRREASATGGPCLRRVAPTRPNIAESTNKKRDTTRGRIDASWKMEQADVGLHLINLHAGVEGVPPI